MGRVFTQKRVSVCRACYKLARREDEYRKYPGWHMDEKTGKVVPWEFLHVVRNNFRACRPKRRVL